jgi:hypothetical protein
LEQENNMTQQKLQHMEEKLHQSGLETLMYQMQGVELSGQLESQHSRIAYLEHQEKQLFEDQICSLKTIAQKQQLLDIVTNQFEASSLACTQVCLVLILIHTKHVYQLENQN